MDVLLAQIRLVPFWKEVMTFSGSYGLSEEMTMTILIGVLTTLLSILMLPKGPPVLIALVSFYELLTTLEIVLQDFFARLLCRHSGGCIRTLFHFLEFVVPP